MHGNAWVQVPLPDEAQTDDRDDAGLAPAATRGTLFGRAGRGRAEDPGAEGSAALLQFWPPPLPIPASLEDDAAVPAAFRCPITYEVMREPAVAVSGQTYERDAITRWLSGAQPHVDPITKAPLSLSHLSPNLALRAVMQDWLRERQGDLARWQWLQVAPSYACDCWRDSSADGDGVPPGAGGDVRGEGVGGERCGRLCWGQRVPGGAVRRRSVPDAAALVDGARRMYVPAAAEAAACDRTRSAPGGGGAQAAASGQRAAMRRQPSEATRRRAQSAGAAELQRRPQLAGLAEDGADVDGADVDVERLLSGGVAGPSSPAHWPGAPSPQTDAGPLLGPAPPRRDAWCACMKCNLPGASPSAVSPRHACGRSCWARVVCGCCGRVRSRGRRSARSTMSSGVRTHCALRDSGVPDISDASPRGSGPCIRDTPVACAMLCPHACASPVNSQLSSLPSSPDMQGPAAAELVRGAWPVLDPDAAADQSASSSGLIC